MQPVIPSPQKIGVDVPWVTSWSAERQGGVGPCPTVDGEMAALQMWKPGEGQPLYARNHLRRQRDSVRALICPMCGEATEARDRWSQTGRFVAAGVLRARTPDLVILDLHLTGSDGFEACRRVRATPGLGLVPILFLTASREFGDYRKSMSAGGSGYLTKPVGRRQLLAAVDDLLSEGRLSPRSAADVGGGD